MPIVKKISSILSTLLVLLLFVFTYNIIQENRQNKLYKDDYALLHSVKYGLFNAEIWNQKITAIVDNKIVHFDLDTNNRATIKTYVQTIINTLIEEAERIVRERNKGKSGFLNSILGSTKQMITDSIIDFKDLQKRVPEFTDTVMAELEKPENQARAKKAIREKLQEFMKTNLAQKEKSDNSPYLAIVNKYKSNDLASLMLATKESISNKMIIMLLITLGIVLLVLLQGPLHALSLWVLTGTTLSLLVSGLMLPMLDIEAKIIQFQFTILDKSIAFENQILFFQSKSIADLVQLLIESGEMKMLFVGILLVLFSIIFPTLKLISTALYYYSKNRIGNNPVTRFFALHSTKWSMADVMVVSIFMAYLGLDGVISKELEGLKSEEYFNIISTNNTHLEVGFFLFLAFVLVSFVLSLRVAKKI